MDVARYIYMAHHRHDPKRDPDPKWFFENGDDFARSKFGALALCVTFPVRAGVQLHEA